MNKTIWFIIGAGIGAGIGSLATYKLVEKKFRNMADEEIKSVKEYYGKKYVTEMAHKIDEEVKEEKAKNRNNIPQEENINDTDDNDSDYLVDEQPLEEIIAPYVINPEEVDWDNTDYKVEYLSYTSDEKLVDRYGEILEKDDYGDAFDHFGEIIEDYVWVKNEELKRYYEIERVSDTYDDLYGEEQ